MKFNPRSRPGGPLRSTWILFWLGCLGVSVSLRSAEDPSPHRQLPGQMHGAMRERATVTVGGAGSVIAGWDHRALQAAVDYVAGLGGGTVLVSAGDFWLRDSLHLRGQVTVRGEGEKTVFHKARSVQSVLELDGDYGEEQITVRHPEGFEVGDGVTIWDRNAGGFHTTVARITGRNGNTFSLSGPLNADCLIQAGAQASTVFPVVSGYHIAGVRLENLTIDGHEADNVALNGCRGGGIFLYRCPGAVIEGCTVRRYHGDGISFQQCNDVVVQRCVSEENKGLGFHPGSGSQRPVVRECVARGNGEDGLFLCWRVKNGLFEGNTLERNGRYGISIGHKDTDNLIRGNRVLANGEDGIFFRNESEGMAGHRNRIESNLIENNGTRSPSAGIRVRGETRDLIFKDNEIRDRRSEEQRRQTVGIRLDAKVGRVVLEQNRIEAARAVQDDRELR